MHFYFKYDQEGDKFAGFILARVYDYIYVNRLLYMTVESANYRNIYVNIMGILD